jgi:hypothetical protein
MDKPNHLADRDSELTITFCSKGAVVTANGWLPVLCVVGAALLAILILAQ